MNATENHMAAWYISKNYLYPIRRRHRYYYCRAIVSISLCYISCRVFMRFIYQFIFLSMCVCVSMFCYLFSRMKFYCFQAFVRTCIHTQTLAHINSNNILLSFRNFRCAHAQSKWDYYTIYIYMCQQQKTKKKHVCES